MPLARIDLVAGKSEEYRQTIGDTVYEAMVDILKAPKHDRFQVINEHPASNFIFDPHFFGIERSAECIFIQLTLAAGRTLEQKRGFYKQVADELQGRLGVRREDVFINLVSVDPEDWSFGNGEASLVKIGSVGFGISRCSRKNGLGATGRRRDDGRVAVVS